MEKFQHMKAFNTLAQTYLKHKSENVYSNLQRQLQILGVADPSIFEPGNSITAEFFVSLHAIMSDIEYRNPLIWSAINVLTHACQNTSARSSLISTYKFTHILTRLLNSEMMIDKKLKLLQLLQELTYGLSITWQEAYLPRLIYTLTEWIDGPEPRIIPLSLNILVNLCYKNLPAVYLLMRSVDGKKFLKTLYKLQNEKTCIRVQVCKMMIILEHLCGDIPELDILAFVETTFDSFGRAFNETDPFQLRQIVDFFKDIIESPRNKEILVKYKKYASNTEQLLSSIKREINSSEHSRLTNPKVQCIAIFLEFVKRLISMPINDLEPFYSQLISLSLEILSSECASTSSLELINSISVRLYSTNNSTVQSEVYAQLEKGFKDMLLILDSGSGDMISANVDSKSRLCALFQLLQELAKSSNIRQLILSKVKCDQVSYIFNDLISIDGSRDSALLSLEALELYVSALDLLSDLSNYDSNWQKRYSELLHHRQIQWLLASALYIGSESVKRKTLSLTGSISFPSQCVALLAKSMSDMAPFVLIQQQKMLNYNIHLIAKNTCQTNDSNIGHSSRIFTVQQEATLDRFIDKLKEIEKNNEISNLAVSSVMELYEYKLASMNHSESALQASLEAASNHTTHLEHRVSQLKAEASRLHALLYQNATALEGALLEKKTLINEVSRLKTTIDEDLHKYKLEIKAQHSSNKKLLEQNDQLNNEMIENKRIIHEIQLKLQDKENELDELKRIHEKTIIEKEARLRENHNKIIEMTKNLNKFEERVIKRERVIEDKNTEIEGLIKNIKALSGQINENEVLQKVQEKSIEEKDKEINTLSSQLNELIEMRQLIQAISTGKKKFDK